MSANPPMWTAVACAILTFACLWLAGYVADMETLDARIRRPLAVLAVLAAIGVLVGGFPLSVWLFS